MAADLVRRINEKPDANDFIRLRREVIRRIIEVRSFEHCWPADQVPARGLVAVIRETVQERDSGTRTREEIARLESLRREERTKETETKAKQAADREALRNQFNRLFSMSGQPHRRGYEFQRFLNALCAFEGINVREAFSIGTSEQIDGAIVVDSHLYLLEARWWAEALSHSDISDLYIKVSGRPIRPRGVIVSGLGYTDECIQVCERARMAEIILVTGRDLFVWFENARPFSDLIRRKSEYAMTEGRIFIQAEEIIERVA